jgi:3-phenylpropionate/trans-cinnamate dioxygenase ferredoxin reductase subunit
MSTDANRPFAIIGGGLAAAEAARTLRSEGYAGALVVVAEEPMLPYERPPLTKAYLRGEVGPETLLAQPAPFYETAGIEVRTGARAIELDVAGRTIGLADGSRIPFDKVLLATGATAARPALEGVEAPWVHLIRTAADADRLRLAAGEASTAVVAGGGWIAAEAAASLRQMGLDVTLVVPGAEVLERHLGIEAGQVFSELHEHNGVHLERASRVRSLGNRAGRHDVRLEDGRVITTDLVVLGLGAAPAVDLARAGGLEAGDGILVDGQLRTSAEGVFAAGDVASAWNPRYAERVRSEHWDNARRQGRTAARNMLGGGEVYDRVPYFFSDQFDLGMELVGRPGIGTEQLVRHESTGTVVLWTRRGGVVAGMHTNLRDSKKAIDRLVTAGGEIDATAFRDPSVPLSEALAART